MEIHLKLDVFLFLYLSSFFFIQRQTIVDPYNNFDFLKRVFLETISHKKYDLEMLNGPGKLLMEKVHLVLRLCGFELCDSLIMRKFGVVNKNFTICVFPLKFSIYAVLSKWFGPYSTYSQGIQPIYNLGFSMFRTI